MTADPCADCGTTGGWMAAGRDVPSRVRGDAFGIPGKLCYSCYSRNRKAHIASGKALLSREAKPALSSIDPLEHQGLVYLVALKFRNRGLELEDLVGWGQIGLINACRLFDPSRGLQFTTYAAAAIKKIIQRAIFNTAHPMRVPEYLMKPLVTGMTELSTRQQTECLQDALAIRRRKRVSGSDLAIPLANLAIAPADRAVEARESAEQVHAILNSLPNREATILRLRFGIGSEPHTYRSAGSKIGIDRNEAKEIEGRAIRRLREKLGVPA